MKNSRFLSAAIVCLVLAAPAWGGGFFEIAFSGNVYQEEDFEKYFVDAPGFGLFLGYETEITYSRILLDVELGYELSQHELKEPWDDSDNYYKNHRGIMGLRVKYGGLDWIEPYAGAGAVVYAFYDNSDALDELDWPNFRIKGNFSGFYMVAGIDFFFSRKGNYAFGIEFRTMDFKVEDTDDGSTELDSRARRLAFKFSAVY